MKITAIKKQVKNEERVSVFVDGGYSFSLTLTQLITSRLKKDLEINDEELKQFIKLSEDGKTKIRALEWALSRPHCQRELKEYLYRKKVEPDLQNEIINDFADKGYIDDRRYAQHLSEVRLKKGKSKRYISQELKQKGISQEIISEVIDVGDELLNEVIAKKITLSRYQDDRKKLINYLISQGYAYSSIVAALAEFDNEGLG